MLLFALFIRPVSMIIGLLVGIMLIFLGTELFDAGYIDLVLNLLTDSQNVLNKLTGVDGAFTILVITMIFLVIYTFILVALVNQCMTAVYVLPDKIIRWIGMPPESSDIGAMVEQTKSGTESKMGEGAQAGAGMGGEMRHSGIQPQAAKHEAKKQGGTDMKTGQP
jgi:defect-in-organelle-trafficking protein DotA